MTYHSGIRNRLNSRRLLFRLSSNSSGQTVLLSPWRSTTSAKASPQVGKCSGSYFFREDIGSLKSKIGSIVFCKLGFSFEGIWEGVKSPSKSVKVIENGDFRGKGRWQRGRGAIRFWKMSVVLRTDPGIRSDGWRRHDRSRFWDTLQMQWLFLLFQRRNRLLLSTDGILLYVAAAFVMFHQAFA